MTFGDRIWAWLVKYVLQPEVLALIGLIVGMSTIIHKWTKIVDWWNSRQKDTRPFKKKKIVSLDVSIRQEQFRSIKSGNQGNTKLRLVATVINNNDKVLSITGCTIVFINEELSPKQIRNNQHAIERKFIKQKLEPHDSEEIILWCEWGEGLADEVKIVKATLMFRTNIGDIGFDVSLVRE